MNIKALYFRNTKEKKCDQFSMAQIFEDHSYNAIETKNLETI